MPNYLTSRLDPIDTRTSGQIESQTVKCQGARNASCTFPTVRVRTGPTSRFSGSTPGRIGKRSAAKAAHFDSHDEIANDDDFRDKLANNEKSRVRREHETKLPWTSSCQQ